MPVWKYRSVEEMPPTPAYEPGSEEHVRRWAALWQRATRTADKRFAAGVFKFSSVAEAQRTPAEDPAGREARGRRRR